MRAVREPVLCALLGLFLLPASARSEEGTDIEEVMRHDQSAMEHFAAEEYGAAVGEFRAAQRLMPATNRLYNIALCEDRLGNLEQALELYRQYLGEPDALSDVRRTARDRIAAIQAELAARREPLETGGGGSAVEAGGGEGSGPEPGPEPTVPERRGLPPVAFYTTLGLTVASGIALTVLGAITLDRHDEFLTLPSQDDPRALPLQEEGRQLALATDVMIGVTSVAAAAAVVLAIFTRWGPSPSSGGQARGLTLAPVAGGGLAAALVF